MQGKRQSSSTAFTSPLAIFGANIQAEQSVRPRSDKTAVRTPSAAVTRIRSDTVIDCSALPRVIASIFPAIFAKAAQFDGDCRVDRSTAHPEAREKQILQKAIQHFATHGFSGSTRELARQLGVTQPLLYGSPHALQDATKELGGIGIEMR